MNVPLFSRFHSREGHSALAMRCRNFNPGHGRQSLQGLYLNNITAIPVSYTVLVIREEVFVTLKLCSFLGTIAVKLANLYLGLLGRR